jgi:hypothetical protein
MPAPPAQCRQFGGPGKGSTVTQCLCEIAFVPKKHPFDIKYERIERLKDTELSRSTIEMYAKRFRPFEYLTCPSSALVSKEAARLTASLLLYASSYFMPSAANSSSAFTSPARSPSKQALAQQNRRPTR